MVKSWWDAQIDKGIRLTKARIKHHELHGVGQAVIEDKARLVKQEKHKKDRKELMR